MLQGDFMKSIEKLATIFIIGGLGYGLLEILFRGFTHWSMIITGGSALLSLYLINQALPNHSIIIKSLIGCSVITIMEFTVGLIVNKIFPFGVWDYTGSPDNILGVISLRFTLCWFAISFIMLSLFITIQKVINLQKSNFDNS